MKPGQCCNHQCNQGRTCQVQADRRVGPSLFWRLLGWLMVDRRSGIDRRQQ
jgi:hypothetical protein